MLIPFLHAFTECWLGGNIPGLSAIGITSTCSLPFSSPMYSDICR